ncbi:unnamed protein product [Clonostachys rosea]|uniref:Uncharacterized protein n=1 Tax=Bionectria ochroleuca TaxID=29856 RepID=A0ABY6U042_BIOOC|nr:unnamed protein product [Clonostachys rosea]
MAMMLASVAFRHSLVFPKPYNPKFTSEIVRSMGVADPRVTRFSAILSYGGYVDIGVRAGYVLEEVTSSQKKQDAVSAQQRISGLDGYIESVF